MTTLLVVLAVWALLSVPIALVVARLFRTKEPDGSELPYDNQLRDRHRSIR
ncbi:hypothetical protein [Nocardia arthritidis]|uniref:Uncharacterized protein n=1 Tax=Nocardia arthritidis TaxID=228602 RepID=A0A6G9YNM5_9NOCA|nr:hypothetical protein [Nocardia arthritidis]QIS14802.1 hypothetical protein F5544_34845 [Nocardia arthritidis]